MSSIPYIRQGTSNVRMPKDYGYVYEQVNNWAALDTLLDPEEGDIVNIRELKTAGGGLAPYQHKGQAIYTSGVWKLIKAEAFHEQALFEYITVDSYVAMNGCIGIICGNAPPTGSSKYYHWNSSASEWLRTPDGTGYIHPTAETWSALPLDNLQVGDRVRVDNLSPGVGTALYNGTDWQLVYAVFPTFDDMMAFSSELIASGAIAIVGDGLGTAPVYFYDDGEWVRTPEGTGYVHPDVEDWEALDSILYPKNGDQVVVTSLDDVELSNGIAKWSELDEEWKLQEATYSGWDPNDFSDAFVGTIANGAIIKTDDGSQGAPIYFWNSTGPEWVRSPEDVNYLWPSTTLGTWGSLNTDGKLNGDRISVPDWTAGGSDGVARYDGTNWKLVEGVVDTITNLGLFIGEKEIGAKVTVGTGVAADPVYFWSGAEWLRTADGSHYIWPQVNDWGALSTRPHAINNDEVHVHSLITHASSGTAQMHGGTWKLIEGKWATVADMNAWAQGAIHPGAIGFVDAHPHHYDEDSSAYYYTGSAWQQLGAAGVTKVHTITSLRDFTASGLTEGDYGYYGNEIYRYNSAVPITGGGTDAMWLPPAVYAGTVNILGKIVGTETIGALPVTTGGVTFAVLSSPNAGSTITQAGDYIQFVTTTFFGTVMSGSALFTINSGTRTYMQVDMAVSYSGTAGAFARVLATEGASQPAWWFHLGPSGSTGTPYFAINTGIQGTTDQLRNGGTVFPTTASGNYDTTEFIDYGRDVATECLRNGIPYARTRRSSTNLGPATPSDGVGFYVQGGFGGAGGTLTFRVKNWRILTW